jgi:hypothetical protein
MKVTLRRKRKGIPAMIAGLVLLTVALLVIFFGPEKEISQIELPSSILLLS